MSAWQLTGAVGIVVVAFTFLPRFLRAGIYTMPEYLEYRYSAAARTVMSVLTVVIYVTVTTTAVLYSGATALETIFGLASRRRVTVIGGIAVVYVLWGGLLAAVWADLFQGSALLIGGLVTLGLGLPAVGGPGAFLAANADRLHMILPRAHPELPWTVLVGGMWIPIFYYCGLNQFIMQRTLAARSLRPGPGRDRARRGRCGCWCRSRSSCRARSRASCTGPRSTRPDQAYPMLVRELIPSGVRGFIFAALAGAVISTLASVLNSAVDASSRWTCTGGTSGGTPSEAELVRVGRVGDAARVPGPRLRRRALAVPEGRGLHASSRSSRATSRPASWPRSCSASRSRGRRRSPGSRRSLLSAPVYGAAALGLADVPYLHRMFATLVLLVAVMALVTWRRPLPVEKPMPVRREMDVRTEPVVYLAGLALIALVVLFCCFFR